MNHFPKMKFNFAQTKLESRKPIYR